MTRRRKPTGGKRRQSELPREAVRARAEVGRDVARLAGGVAAGAAHVAAFYDDRADAIGAGRAVSRSTAMGGRTSLT